MPDATLRATLALLRALEWVDSLISQMPLVGPAKHRAVDKILDTIFGPAEDIDYVSTTAPRTPPPTL